MIFITKPIKTILKDPLIFHRNQHLGQLCSSKSEKIKTKTISYHSYINLVVWKQMLGFVRNPESQEAMIDIYY